MVLNWPLKTYFGCTEKLRNMVFLMVLVIMNTACNSNKKAMQETDSIRLVVLEPAHFHAALVQKSAYENVSPVVHVYAPEGAEADAYLKLITQYNTRKESPTHWQQIVYKGKDDVEKMLSEKKGNVVILAGNNQHKTANIKKAVEAGFNVLSDKPMAINSAGFNVLEEAFNSAAKKHVLLYDIMTERYEITNLLQREFSQQRNIFGELEKGTLENPAVVKESVHHFFKQVSGTPLIRPAWYYDVEQEGDGLVDVTTHLIDLVQWSCFPEQTLDYKKDVKMIGAKRWPTAITAAQYKQSTHSNQWPNYLLKDVKDSILNVYANGEMNYTLKGIHAKVAVKWNYQAPEGSGDTHYSIMRGTKANLIIKQGKEQQFKPILYIAPVGQVTQAWEQELARAVKKMQAKYPGITLNKSGKYWEIVVPEELRTGHEAHFAEVTRKYLQFLKDGKLPAWEVPNMLAKYYTTTQALEKAMLR